MGEDHADQEGQGLAVVASFYEGTLTRLFHGSRTGLVRTGNGREVPFSFLTVELLGVDGDFDRLYEGMPVGFDLTRTSSGLRVTKIKVFDRS